jgi:hypothetical protein
MRRWLAHAALLAAAVLGASACGGAGNTTPPSPGAKKGVETSTFALSIRGEVAFRVNNPTAPLPTLDPVNGTTIILPGGGLVTGPNGISCGVVGTVLHNTCSARFAWGTTGVVLTATPDASGGYNFFAFAGACGGQGACAIDITSDRFVAIRFAKTQAGLGAHPNFTDARIHGPEYLAKLAGKPTSWTCTDCHGASLDGAGLAPSCNACHLAAGWASWQTNCSFCHGARNPTTKAGYDPAAHPEYAAPPDDVAARLSGTSNGAAGAHQAHLRAGVACGECHVVPTSTAHVNGVDDVRFGALASANGAAPTWTASSLSCASTYCHGNFSGGNGPTLIAWNATVSCTSCHGAPPPLPHPQASADCGSCHPGFTSTSVNAGLHANGAVDLDIRASCASCHTTQSAMLSGSTYHHVMGSDVALLNGDTNYPYNPTPTPNQTSQKNCAMCHVAHGLFSGTPGANLRSDALTSPPVKTASDTGVCLGCHAYAQTKDTFGQKSDGTLGTYAIDAFTGSAHDFAVNGQFAGGTVSLSCVKCHNSGATQFQNGTYTFALHDGTDRRLRGALGRALPVADDDAEDFCFRCHSNIADGIGGVMKAADLKDWYGVAQMPNGSTGLFTQMTGTPAIPVTTGDTLYFKPAAQGTPAAPTPTGATADNATFPTSTLYLTSSPAQNPPAGYYLSSGTYVDTTLRQNAMSVFSSASATTDPVAVTSGVTNYERVAQFISPPLAKAATWSSGASFALNYYRSETNSNNNCFLRYAVFRLSNGSATQVVNTSNSSEFSTTAGTTSQNMSLNGASTFAAGDQILVEVEIAKTAPTAAGTCTLNWGNTTSDQTRLVLPATSDGTFPEFSGSPAAAGTWVARSMEPIMATTSETLTVSGGSYSAYATQTWQVASFVSPPVTASVAIPASPWTLAVYGGRGSLSSNQAYVRYRIYQWTSSGMGVEIVPWRTYATSSLASGSGLVTITTPAGAPLTLFTGDKVVVEVEIESMNTTASGTMNGTITVSGSSLKLPVPATFQFVTPATVATSGHLGQRYTAIHRPNPAEETLAYLAANKHTECSDCHDPHAAKRGNQSDGGTATAGTSTSLTDANQSWAPNAWVGYHVDITTGTGSGGRAQITSNTATQLVFANLATAPASGSGYRIAMKANGGVASSAGASSLTDSQSAVGGAKTWQTDAFAGWQVNIVVGTGVGQTRTIQNNTSNSITVTQPWSTALDTTSRYVITKLPGVLAGATGVSLDAWGAGTPTAWGESVTYDPAPNSATAIPPANVEWQVCFKCHSGANVNLTGWKSSWTDSGVAFNPRNQSYHPVIAPAAAVSGTTGFGNTQLTAAQLNPGWKPGDLMYCSDCHGNNDTSYGASQGPHASAVPFVLRGPNTRWPRMADGVTWWKAGSSGNGNSESFVGTKDGLFCRNCHAALTSIHTRSDHNGVACTGCHLMVPHGGKLKRLIATTNVPAALKDPGQAPQLKAYAGGTSDNSTSCGANCTTHHNLAPSATNSW